MTTTSRPALALLLLAAGATAAAAQGAPAGKAMKGVWEPVSYSEDLGLTDVVFVTPEVGWVSGAKGTILHTKDGGSTWTPQLGGDPASPDPKIDRLRFYDERHGWAVQQGKLLRTTDGENWEEAGALPYAFADYTFVSPVDGFAAATPSTQGDADHVFRTRNGGGTWEPVARCTVKVVIDATTREIRCHLGRFAFPSRNVGYVVASQFNYNTSRWPPIIGKTEDGGETWQFLVGPGNPKEAMLSDLAFTDEQNGVVYAVGEVGLQKFYVTSDGARTWKSVVASPPSSPRFYFADPEVGWSIGSDKLLYTTNGGKRWTAVAQRFPSYQIGVSFPRRDRAYVVGDHGLVLRYRILEPGEKIAASAKPAPAMPPFVTPLEQEASEALAVIKSLQEAGGGAATGAGEESGALPPDESEEEEVEVARGNTDAAAGAPLAPIAPAKLGKLDVLLTALGTTVPSFLDQFTNLNLLAARLRSAGDLPARLSELKTAIAAVKKAPDNASAQSALAQALTAAQGLQAAAAVAIQRKLPAEGAGPSAAPGASAESPAADEESSEEEGEE